MVPQSLAARQLSRCYRIKEENGLKITMINLIFGPTLLNMNKNTISMQRLLNLEELKMTSLLNSINSGTREHCYYNPISVKIVKLCVHFVFV